MAPAISLLTQGILQKADTAFDGKSAYPSGSIYEKAIALQDSQ